MNKATVMLSVAVITLLAGSALEAADALKGTLVPVTPVPNSVGTNVFGISDSGAASGVITGSWLDASGVEHGYVGPANGSSYTTFDDPKSPAPGTEPRAINDKGYVTGFSNSQNGSTSGDIPFERDPSGNITEVTKSGTLLNGLIQGINRKYNEFAGGYINSSLEAVGYLGKNGTYKEGIKLKGLANTGYAARGIDDAGDIVGWYYDSHGVQHGLLIVGGTAQQLDPSEPNLASNVLEGINDKSTITGFWTDISGIIHGYYYNLKRKKFTTIKVPGSTAFVQAWGIDESNRIAIGSDAGNYIYCPPGASCPPGARGSYKLPVKPKPQLP